MVYLGVQGPRWGEIAGLRVRHVHFGADAHVVIEWQRTRGKKGRMIEGETKSRNSERPLAIPVWLGDMLFDHLSARGGVGDDDYVFVAPEGGALHYGNWRKRFWLPARNRADLPKLRFHDLRRVAATALDEAGVSRAVKQHRIGATEAVVEGIYTGVTDPSDRAAADRVGEMFRPSWAPPAP
jgi:integrase